MMPVEVMTAEHTLAGLLRGFDDVNVRQDLVVSGIALDSRKVQSGDLFLAVAGSHTHGLQHARQALALGANAVGIGRLQGIALGAGGEDAVVRMLEILGTELSPCQIMRSQI